MSQRKASVNQPSIMSWLKPKMQNNVKIEQQEVNSSQDANKVLQLSSGSQQLTNQSVDLKQESNQQVQTKQQSVKTKVLLLPVSPASPEIKKSSPGIMTPLQKTSPLQQPESINILKLHPQDYLSPATSPQLSSASNTKLTPGIKQYHHIRSLLHKDTILLLQNGAFYELYEEDCDFGEQQLSLKAANKGENYRMSGIPVYTSDFFVKRIIQLGRSVCLASQAEGMDPRFKVQVRKIVQVISPGSCQRLEIIGSKSGVAFLIGGQLYYYQAISSKFSHIQCLDSREIFQCLTVLQPAEIVVQDDEQLELQKLNKLGSFLRVCSEHEFKDCLLLSDKDRSHGIIDIKGLTGEVPTLIKDYLQYFMVQSVDQQQQQELFGGSQQFILLQSTILSLDLLQNEKFSLVRFLDHTKTAFGKRYLSQLIIQPFSNSAPIFSQQKLINVLNSMSGRERSELLSFLNKMLDFEKIIDQFQARKVGLVKIAAFRNLCQCLVVSNQLFGFVTTVKPLNESLQVSDLQKYVSGQLDFLEGNFQFNSISGFPKQEKEKNDAVQIQKSQPDFVTLNKQITQFHQSLHTFILDLDLVSHVSSFEYAKSLSSKEARQSLGFTAKPNRIFFVGRDLLQEKDVKKFADRFKLKHSETTNSVIKFQFPEKFAEREAELDEQQSQLVQVLIERFLTQLNFKLLGQGVQAIKTLDVCQSFQQLPQRYPTLPWCVAEIQQGAGQIQLVGAVHPIACQQFWVPLTFDLSAVNCLVGSNMSGKSSFMRTVAAAALLAQIGAPVPAVNCRISPFSQIICRIGGYDFGNSTFQTEMLDVASILRKSDNALVFLDELGRGTEAAAADALAAAVFRDLRGRAAGLVSTHSLAVAVAARALGSQVYTMKSRVEGADVKFSYQIQQVDRIQAQSSGISFGCEIAQLAGVDPRVVDRAKALRKLEQEHYAGQLEAFLDGLVE